jgi:hypothetical protein
LADLQIFVYRFLATCHCRGGFVTRPSEIGTISALSDKNGMNMGGIAVYTAMPKGGLKTRPYSVNGTINTNL